ncbi:MAG: hypothetical protein NC314_06865 [Roseburia sp.]|nr:hypothetical protein [Ruminococcus sp.]MCM1155405.1 hypothetical protein [Roseburia sp.]MCM1242548.1 hypothetical protein [Roseburia sp.]
MYRVKISIFILFAVLAVALSIWGPERLARYQDKSMLNEIHAQAVEEAGAGYRYKLNNNEKLYILSRCLDSQSVAESEQNVLTHAGDTGIYQDIEGSYAFIANYKNPSDMEITDEQIYETCNEAMDILKEAGVMPEAVRKIMAPSYDAILYSAIDVLEPRNNIAVWKLSLSNSQTNANKENRLIDAYIGADDGKMYEFYVRTSLLWEDIDTDAVIEAWSGYMGLGSPEPYESDNPLLETTPYFKKYVFPGMGEGRTIVTVGFYEGINELFLKISR